MRFLLVVAALVWLALLLHDPVMSPNDFIQWVSGG